MQEHIVPANQHMFTAMPLFTRPSWTAFAARGVRCRRYDASLLENLGPSEMTLEQFCSGWHWMNIELGEDFSDKRRRQYRQLQVHWQLQHHAEHML
mmetsp:Transcript_8395/g.14124  ORF Transcript_8395/g.14124 Transcript_8395/m.14124 type:complete len:96 (-) Transcript_8395:61-348(-)